MAADCNHDGEVDEIDVAILEEAGMLALSIDQTKTTQELVEVCSAFEDYVNLISQTVEPETVITEEETAAQTEETTTQAETTETQPEQQTEQSIFDVLTTIIQKLVSFLTYAVSFIKNIF